MHRFGRLAFTSQAAGIAGQRGRVTRRSTPRDANRRRSEPTTEVVGLSKPIIAPAVANAMLWAPRKRAGDGRWTEAASDKFQALLPDCLVASLPSPAAPITSKASSVSDKSLDHPKDPARAKVRSKPRTSIRWRDDAG